MNTPEISIVIVGYNAAEFLKLTLFAVQKSIKNINAEVLFVDNSNHQKLEPMVNANFPFVRIISNNTNLGFGRANNLALKECTSDLALLLNPDTIITEIVLKRVINYYYNNINVGGIGVRMLDGTGSFLRESKRGFPDIFTSFCKFSGFSRLFPKNPKFSKYYAENIDEYDINEVDILAGAFMTIPRSESGDFLLFDPSFFMYGEDVDLSYRLQQKFGSNIYLGDESIIHFKGKSTQPTTGIIYHFFHSMWIFYKLHLGRRNNLLTNTIVYTGIKSLSYFQMLRSKYLSYFKRKTTINSNQLEVKVISKNQSLIKSIGNISLCGDVKLDTLLKIDTEQLIIFDLNFIDQQKVITFVDDNRGKCKFGFLTHDYSHFIMSESPFDKGHVFALNRD